MLNAIIRLQNSRVQRPDEEVASVGEVGCLTVLELLEFEDLRKGTEVELEEVVKELKNQRSVLCRKTFPQCQTTKRIESVRTQSDDDDV